MRLFRPLAAMSFGLMILACGGDLDMALDDPLVTDGDEDVDGDEDTDDGEADEDGDTDDGDTDEGEGDGDGEAVEVDLGSAAAAAGTFAAAVNAGDSDAMSAAMGDGCDACSELAEEAADEGFEVRIDDAREKGDRAVARIQACEGDDCDNMVGYLEKIDGDWRLVNIDEDTEHGKGYLRGKAPAKR